MIMFKNYNPQGPADKLLVYLTVFIQHCLRDIGNLPATHSKKDAEDKVAKLVKERVPNVGDKDFFMNDQLDKASMSEQKKM